MNRREFFKFLGKVAVVGAAAKIAPGILQPVEAVPQVGPSGSIGPSG